jgi:hypothetical protein
MYLIIYCYCILRLLGRMLFGLVLSERKTARLLKNIEIEFNGKFESSTFKKIKKFQGIQQFIINDSFAKLENRYTNTIERENNKLYFILASLYDDLMDEEIVSKDILNQMFLNPAHAKPKSFNEAVLIDTHLKLLNLVQDKEAYQKVLNKIHEAQTDSLDQLKNDISLERILSITERKGGYSLLMCRHYIQISTNETIDNCWYQLGGMIQMTNDLYDIYKDTIAGIHTFANTQESFEKIKADYELQVKKYKSSIEKLSYTNSNKLKLQIKLSLIPALGYVALENLNRLQGENNTLQPFKDYPRKELIIDMEKMKNILKLFRYSYQIAKN